MSTPLVTSLSPNARCARKWTGNDRVNRHHFGRVRLIESPLTILLHWKESGDAPARLIGAFRLDLVGLLKAGFVQRANGHPGEIVLRFQHTERGDIQISTGWQSRQILTIA